MKKLLAAILVFLPLTAFADSVTPRLSLTEPDINSPNWGTKLNNNFGIIDTGVGVLGKTNTWTLTNTFQGPVVISSYTTITSSVAFSTITVQNLTATVATIPTLTVTSSATVVLGAFSTITSSSATLTGVAGSTVTFSSATFTATSPGRLTLSSTVVDGSSLQGTAGQSLQSNGASAPTWVNVPSAILATTSTFTAPQTFTSTTTFTGLISTSTVSGTGFGRIGMVLSSSGSAAAPTWAYAKGAIIQVVEYTNTTSSSTTGSTYIFNGTSQTITPTVLNSTISIRCALPTRMVSDGSASFVCVGYRIKRATTVIRTWDQVACERFNAALTNASTEYIVPLLKYDFPQSLSSQTYTVEMAITTGSGGSVSMLLDNTATNPTVCQFEEIAPGP